MQEFAQAFHAQYSTNTSTGNFTDCLWTILGEQYSNCNSVTVSFEESGWYDVNLHSFATSGCVSEFTFEDFMYVEPDPVASFHFTPENLTTLHSDVDQFDYALIIFRSLG